MRWLISVLFVLPVTMLSQDSPGPAASIEGRILDRVTSQGIAGATAYLTGISGDRVVSYSVKTNAGGQFSFRNIAPSSGYWLLALHGESHVQTLFEQRGLHGVGSQIAVRAGQQIRDIQIAMFPAGEITGRVIDAGGKAVADAVVSVMRRSFHEDAPILQLDTSSVMTNRRGEYRITALEPGLYYLRVGLNTGTRFRVDPRRGESLIAQNLPGFAITETDGYPFVYFPGTTEEYAAQAVSVHAGAHVDGIDVTIAKAHSRRVQGVVIDPATGLGLGPSNLLLVYRNAARDDPPMRSLTSSKDGAFDLRAVLPGSYFLVANAGNAPAQRTGRVALDVGGADVRDLKIPVTAGFNLAGRISLDGSLSKAIDTSLISVTLRPRPPSASGRLPAPTFIEPRISGEFNSTEVRLKASLAMAPIRASNNNGTLMFRGILPWDYEVEVSAPETLYVQSIRLGSMDVTGSGIRGDIPAQGELDIVMGSPAGRIAGRVRNAADNPVEALRVVLIPDEGRRNRKDLYRTILTDETGQFQFASLPPGDYKIFAWEFTEENSWLDADFMRLYEDKGTSIRIDEGSSATVEVRPLPPWY